MATVRVDLEVNDKGAHQTVVNLGGSFKDLGGHAKATQSIVQGMFQGIGQSAFHLMEEIPKLFLEMGKAAVEFATHTVEHLMHVVHALEGFMAKTGLSSQSAQELGVAMRIAGGDSEALAGMITKMQKALVAGKDAFAALGLDVKKLKNEDPAKAFTEIAEKIKAIKNPTEQAAAMLAIFGKGGAEAARLIKEGVVELSEDAHHLGAILGDEDVKAAAELGKESRRLGIAWESVQNQFAATLVSSPALQEILKAVVETMATLAHWVHENRGAIELWVSAGLKEAVLWLKTLKDWAEKAGVALKAMVPSGILSALKEASAAANEAALTAEAVRLARKALAPHEPGGGGGFDPGAAAAAAKEAAAIHAINVEAVREMNNRITNEAKALKTRQAQMKAHVDFIIYEAQREQEAREISSDMIMETFLQNMHEEAVARELEAVQLDRSALKWGTYGAALSLVAEEMGGALGLAISGLGGAFDGLAAHQAQAAENLRRGATEAEKASQKYLALANAIGAAIGAFHAGQAAGSPGKGALAGAGKGAAAGAAFGLPGMILGGIGGGILGFLGGKSAQQKGQQEELKALTAEFEALKQKAAAAGVTIRDSLNPRTATEFKSAIDEVNRSMDITAEAQQKLQEAIERYGFTVEELGPAMARQKLDEQAAQLYQDWMLLNGAGVDHLAIIERMGPAISDYVNTAIGAGVEIPEAMRPIIDALFEQGKLLHENGDAYTQAEKDGITYAKTMSQMFQALIDKVTILVNLLAKINGITLPTPPGTTPPGTAPPGEPPGGGGGGGGGRRGEGAGFARGGGGALHVTVNVAGDGDAAKIQRAIRNNENGITTTLRRAMAGR